MRRAPSCLPGCRTGAHLYVCGDAKRMAKDVETALTDIAAAHGGKSAADAKAFITGLKVGGPLPDGRLLMAHERRPGRAQSCTTCPYCGVGCGMRAYPDGHGGATIAGDPAHPANFGRLCSKGAALGETLGLENRLLRPMLGKRAVGWSRSARPTLPAGSPACRTTTGRSRLPFISRASC